MQDLYHIHVTYVSFLSLGSVTVLANYHWLLSGKILDAVYTHACHFSEEPNKGIPGMSKRATSSGNATITRGLCVSNWYTMIEGIKSYKSEVKASKSDKQLRSYGHLQFCVFSYSFSLA